MKTKEELLRKLSKKMDSYNRKAEKHDYPKVSFDIKECCIHINGNWLTAGGNPKGLFRIIFFIFYYEYMNHLVDNMQDIAFKLRLHHYKGGK